VADDARACGGARVRNPEAGRLDLRGTLDAYRGRIAILFVLCVAVYFLIAFGEQAWRAQQLQAEVREQHASIAQLDRDNAALRDEQASLSGGSWVAYVEARARRDLNLANPDETVLMVRWAPSAAESNATPAPSSASDDEANWRKWLDIFSGE
jgi:cell division protein FtsB